MVSPSEPPLPPGEGRGEGQLALGDPHPNPLPGGEGTGMLRLLLTLSDIYSRQAQVRPLPDGTIPALDCQWPGGVPGVLSNTGLHRGAAEDALHGWRGWGMPANATNADQGVGFGHEIDHRGIRA